VRRPGLADLDAQAQVGDRRRQTLDKVGLELALALVVVASADPVTLADELTGQLYRGMRPGG
jgi:hypothetical protein